MVWIILTALINIFLRSLQAGNRAYQIADEHSEAFSS